MTFTADNLVNIISRIASYMANAFLPVKCPICLSACDSWSTQPFCHHCWDKIAQYHGNSCQTCGCPTISPAISCQQCIQRDIYFDGISYFGLHKDVLQAVIQRLKFFKNPSLAVPLSRLAVTKICFEDVHCIVAVPLHKNRLIERGFNQSAHLAKEIAKRLNKPLHLDVLVKIKNTKPQSLLDKQQRIKNVTGAYLVKNVNAIKHKSILLIDDVVTTSATVNECAKTLKSQGATKVYVFAIAHAVPETIC